MTYAQGVLARSRIVDAGQADRPHLEFATWDTLQAFDAPLNLPFSCDRAVIVSARGAVVPSVFLRDFPSGKLVCGRSA